MQIIIFCFFSLSTIVSVFTKELPFLVFHFFEQTHISFFIHITTQTVQFLLSFHQTYDEQQRQCLSPNLYIWKSVTHNAHTHVFRMLSHPQSKTN